MRKEARFVLLLATLVLTGCAETAYCHSPAETPEACAEANARASDCDGPKTEQPKAIEPDYDRRDYN